MLSISMHMQNYGKFHQFVLKILNGNEILTSLKGHNCVINLQKLTHNNPDLGLANINAYAKFILRILSGNEILTKIMNHQGP